MAVAYVTAASIVTNAANPSTGSFNSGTTGTDRILLVFVNTSDSGTLPASTVTYNGTALTHAATNGKVACWYLVNPATGSNVLSLDSPGTMSFNALCVVLQGVDQTTPISGSVLTKTGTSTTPHTNSITVGSGGMAVAVARRGYNFANTTLNVSAPSTSRAYYQNADYAARAATRGDTGAIEYTLGASVAWQTIGLSLSAAASGAPTLSDIKAASITATTVQGTYDYAF